MKQYRQVFLFIVLALLVAFVSGGTTSAATDDLLISEYVEGSSFNKAIEIYNGTGDSVDLLAEGYTLELYSNGASTPSQTATLSGMMADGDVFVLAHASADAAILAVADVTNSSVINFNGDDAIVLRKAGAVVDAFGQIGVDPGSEWPGGGQDDTLRRSADVCAGDTDAEDAFDASLEWATFAQNTFDGLGNHTADCDGNGNGGDIPDVAISEIRIDQPSTDNDEYFELAGEAGASLDGLTYLVIGDGSSGSGQIENVTSLSGQTIGSNGFFVAAESTFTLGTADLTTNLNFENSDNVTHLLVTGFSGADGDDLDTDDDGTLDVTPWTEVVDLIALVEEENPPSSTEYHYGPPSVGPDGSFVPAHAFNCDGVWLIGAYDPVEGVDTPGAANACPAADVAISEIRIDQPGGDDDEYFELAGEAGVSLDGLTYLVIGDGTGGSGQIENVTNLSGNTIGSSGFFVAAESTFTLGTANLVTGLNFENSDNVTHLLVAGFTGSNGDDLDLDDDGALDVTPWAEVVDLIALVEEENPPSGTEYHYGPPSVGPDGSFVPAHAYLCEDGWRIGDFGGGDDTPGAENACGADEPIEAKIHEVQGSGSSVAITDPVLVEAIVVGDFQGDDELSAFFIQEEDADVDGDANTSEGIMVYCGSCTTDVSVGDLVQVTGQPEEFFSMSQIDAAGSDGAVSIVSSGNPLPALTEITLPMASFDALEKYEGMYVTFPQELVISEFFNFDRYGEIVLTTERQFQPTATYDPGSPEAAQLALDNALGRIMLDDGRDIQNPDPAIHPNGEEFTLDNRFRGGDIVQNATGVLQYAFGLYRLHPTQGADYRAVNARPAAHQPVGGNLEVVSFNVLNYFNTIDDGSDNCGPLQDQECRGADNEDERIRQLDKIVSAMVDLDADVLGIIEVENTADVEAMADIVDELNAVFGPETYAYVDTGTIGTDAIKVGFIYKTTTVSLVGDYAVLDTPEFVDPNNIGEPKNRAALAQTFMDNETGGIFTAVVNHLKSKGSSCGEGDDDPEAGSCNLTRTLAAQELADWLATDPTNSGDGDFLIIGDLNSYDKEDPIDVLKANGYADLLLDYQGEFAYSYVFDGQLGYLDYGMANADMAEEVTGATVWHINADEPDIIDYDTSFKQDAQDALYEDNAYRSSDHDPVIVGLNVCDEIAPTLSVAMSQHILWPPNHQYVTVTPIIDVDDNFDEDVTVTLLSVTSNEPDNGLGDGDTPNDIVINDDGTVDLRAERSGTGDGRVYTFTYEAVDDCGNSTIAITKVAVPLGKGHSDRPGRGR